MTVYIYFTNGKEKEEKGVSLIDYSADGVFEKEIRIFYQDKRIQPIHYVGVRRVIIEQ